MKAALGTLACAVAMLAAAPSAAGAAPAQATKTTTTTADSADRALDKKIARQLKADSSLKHYNVKVSVDKGVATLTGSVATEAERARAAELAKSAGASRVDNQLLVEANAASKGTVGTIERKSKQGAERAKAGGQSVGDTVSDGWITTTIKTKFMGDELTRASNIDVDATNHVVTLSGTAVSAAARAKAVQIARETNGVKRVVDKLKIAK